MKLFQNIKSIFAFQKTLPHITITLMQNRPKKRKLFHQKRRDKFFKLGLPFLLSEKDHFLKQAVKERLRGY